MRGKIDSVVKKKEKRVAHPGTINDKKVQNFKPSGLVQNVSRESIDRFLKIIPEPNWIRWKIQIGEIIIEPEKIINPHPPIEIFWEDILYLCTLLTVEDIIDCIDDGTFVVMPSY